MVKAQRFVYANKYVGEAKETDFALVTEELGDLKDGGKCLVAPKNRCRAKSNPHVLYILSRAQRFS